MRPSAQPFISSRRDCNRAAEFFAVRVRDQAAAIPSCSDERSFCRATCGKLRPNLFALIVVLAGACERQVDSVRAHHFCWEISERISCRQQPTRRKAFVQLSIHESLSCSVFLQALRLRHIFLNIKQMHYCKDWQRIIFFAGVPQT